MAYKIPYPTMNWEADDAGEALALFRQKMELYFDDEEITDKKIQARKICRSIGDEGLKKLNASGYRPRMTRRIRKNYGNFLKTCLESK